MSLRKNRALRKRDAYLPLSGSVIESDPTPTNSVLAQNSASLTNSPTSETGIPLLVSSAADALSASTSTTPSSTASASASTGGGSSSDQISIGTVIGACAAALIALGLSVLLAFYCSKRHQRSPTLHTKSRNTVNNVSRRRSHLEAWERIDDNGDHSMKQRPLSGPLGAMFHRTNSNSSGEKSTVALNRESVGTMQNFVKYHPGLAAEMASQSANNTIADDKVAKPAPVLWFAGRGLDMTPPVSLDGDTIRGDSFFSLRSSLPNSMSPVMMATERSTPPAITSMHRWESAEVLHVDQIGSEAEELQNPFSDGRSSVKSSIRTQNPFFSGRDHPVRRTLLVNPHEDENPFADTSTPRDSSEAIQSLIAALEVSTMPNDNDRIVSVQSSLYSRATVEDGDSAITVAAFPYPPNRR